MTVIPFAHVPDATIARETGRPSARDVVLEREALLKAARATVRKPEHLPAKVIRDACITLQTHGDGVDFQEADTLLFALHMREKRRMADEAKAEAARLSRARRSLGALTVGLLLAMAVAVAAYGMGWVLP